MRGSKLGDRPGRMSIKQGLDDIKRMKKGLEKLKEEVTDMVNEKTPIKKMAEHECLGCVYLTPNADGKPTCFTGKESKSDECFTPRPI